MNYKILTILFLFICSNSYAGYFIFHDDDGQVQAASSSPNAPDPTSWETVKGYTRLEVTKGQWDRIDRDKKLTFTAGGAIDTIKVSVNAVQPVVSATDTRRIELQDKIDDDSATLNDIREFLRSN